MPVKVVCKGCGTTILSSLRLDDFPKVFDYPNQCPKCGRRIIWSMMNQADVKVSPASKTWEAVYA